MRTWADELSYRKVARRRLHRHDPIFRGRMTWKVWGQMVRFVADHRDDPDLARVWRDWCAATTPGWIPPPTPADEALELATLWHRAAEHLVDLHAKYAGTAWEPPRPEEIGLLATLKRIVLQQVGNGDVLGAAQMFGDWLLWRAPHRPAFKAWLERRDAAEEAGCDLQRWCAANPAPFGKAA